MSNSPVSITAARCGFAVALLRRLEATYRDAKDAYVQSKFEVDATLANLVELPRAWWPTEWFYDDEMLLPKFKRPAAPLVYSLPGHPKAGNLLGGPRGGDHVGEVVLEEG